MDYVILVPSYGRDFTSKKEVLAAWDANKDFTINSYDHPHDGRQINKPQARPGDVFHIRYKRLTQVMVITVA